MHKGFHVSRASPPTLCVCCASPERRTQPRGYHTSHISAYMPGCNKECSTPGCTAILHNRSMKCGKCGELQISKSHVAVVAPPSALSIPPIPTHLGRQPRAKKPRGNTASIEGIGRTSISAPAVASLDSTSALPAVSHPGSHLEAREPSHDVADEAALDYDTLASDYDGDTIGVPLGTTCTEQEREASFLAAYQA